MGHRGRSSAPGVIRPCFPLATTPPTGRIVLVNGIEAWIETAFGRIALSSQRYLARLQHAAVELFRGTMVSHGFIAYRDDRSEVSQPINFAGDHWRD